MITRWLSISFVFLTLLSSSYLAGQETLKERLPWLPLGREEYEPYGQKLRLGPFILHPIASEAVMWDDNIFLQEENRISGIISVTEIGIRADMVYKQKAYLLNLLKGRYNHYFNYSKESNFEYLYRANGKYVFSRTLSLDGYLRFEHQVEPVEILLSERYARNVLNMLVGLDFRTRSEKLSFRAEIEEKNYNFFGKVYGRVDHNEVYARLQGLYHWTPKTSLGGRIGYGMLTYTEDLQNDYNYITVAPFAQGELKPKLKYFAEVGFFLQTIVTENGTNIKEYSGPYWALSAQYEATEKLLLKASLQRRIEYHTSVSYQVVDKLEGRLQWKIRFKMMFGARLSFEFSNPSVDDGVVAGKAWRAVAGVSYYYRILDYLYLGADYEHIHRSSDMPLASYSANRFYLHISFAF